MPDSEASVVMGDGAPCPPGGGGGVALGAQEQARAQPALWVLGGQPGAVIAFVPITKAQPGLQPLPHTLGSQTGHICPRQL